MNANRLIQEADAVAWIERSKGNCRAASIIEAMADDSRQEGNGDMTESELLASPDFLAWCRVWEEELHCPLPMADWALENVGELAFEACVWAHEKEERYDPWDDRLTGRVYPRRQSGSKTGKFVWWSLTDVSQEQNDDVPIIYDYHPNTTFHSTFPAAIAYYLTHFDRELAAKYPPKVKAAVPA